MVSDENESESKGHTRRVIDHVVEQRVSNLAQGLLTLGTMSSPLLIVLHLIPQGVLAGLFFVMGVQALQANGITTKLLFLARDKGLTPRSDPLQRIERRSAIWTFVGLELFGFGATFAITQTIAAVGFPIIILLLIPARTWVLPRYFTSEELRILDAPTASPFTMESRGGIHGDDDDGAVPTDFTTPQSASTKGTATPIEEGDEAERGEASGPMKDLQQPGTGARRRSFRQPGREEAIELDSIRDANRSRRSLSFGKD